jgi:signal transduction histidine kinase
MVLVTDIINKINRIIYSRVLWIIILNAILIIIPISGLTFIRSKDYKSLYNRSIATRELSRSIISSANLNIPLELIANLPVIAPYQRILIVESGDNTSIYDTGWLTNPAITSFEYDLFLTRTIGRLVDNVSFPELGAEEIIKRMAKYIQPGIDKFSIIDYRFLYSLKNFSLEDGLNYSLIILMDKSDLIMSSKINKILLLIISLFSMLMGIIVSTVYYRLMIKPLHVLTDEVELVKNINNNPEKIFSMKDRVDEIGLLSNAFFKSSNELIKQRESLKIFTSDVLHELKNPLTGIRNGIEILQLDNVDNPENNEILSLISKESGRIEKLLFDIREYSLNDKGENPSEWCNPGEVINNLLDLYFKAEIKSTIKSNNLIKLSEGQLVSVLTNLIDNAVSFSPETQSVSLDYYAEKYKTYLTISDSGPGIPQEEKDKIYKRFYSNRESASGKTLHSGLGLSIVKNILENNNHTIECLDNNPEGTRFMITFNNL